ncbi:MAG TPA: MoxR family ATPase [Bacteroidetes bacterium]|nr:MoxR family ATPase [Bacteroidota bacterium]
MQQKALTDLARTLSEQGYIADKAITMSIFLAQKLQRPLLVEGPPGVGKTEIAKVLARASGTELIRLQCYEGLHAEQALYEWNYQKQLLALKMMETQSLSVKEKEDFIFDEKYLLKRPLLRAITMKKAPVLLIDEVDRADEEFESFLLELLSDWQISIPEMGVVKATTKPTVIVTSNRMRDLSEALRRRCFYLWIDYPDFEKELEIVRQKTPGIDEKLGGQICHFMQALRQMKLDKTPGIAETLDWAMALAALHIDHLEKQVVEETLGIVLKDWKDIREAQLSLSELFERVGIKMKVN